LISSSRVIRTLTITITLLGSAAAPLPSFAEYMPDNSNQVEYTACMDRAITHKYAMIAAGVSYQEAHQDYLFHTQQCYEYYYGG
jgi:hypothetical protein